MAEYEEPVWWMSGNVRLGICRPILTDEERQRREANMIRTWEEAAYKAYGVPYTITRKVGKTNDDRRRDN
jgi:hypothetical protein